MFGNAPCNRLVWNVWKRDMLAPAPRRLQSEAAFPALCSAAALCKAGALGPRSTDAETELRPAAGPRSQATAAEVSGLQWLGLLAFSVTSVYTRVQQ